MTERQYVDLILHTAQTYMDSYGCEPRKPDYPSLERWNTVKQELSAPLVIEMAEAWLEKHGKGAE